MKLTPAIVYWEDAQFLRREEMPETLPLMCSIGFIEIKADRIILTHLRTPEADEDNYNGIRTILPKGMVKKIINLDYNPMKS